MRTSLFSLFAFSKLLSFYLSILSEQYRQLSMELRNAMLCTCVYVICVSKARRMGERGEQDKEEDNGQPSLTRRSFICRQQKGAKKRRISRPSKKYLNTTPALCPFTLTKGRVEPIGSEPRTMVRSLVMEASRQSISIEQACHVHYPFNANRARAQFTSKHRTMDLIRTSRRNKHPDHQASGYSLAIARPQAYYQYVKY